MIAYKNPKKKQKKKKRKLGDRKVTYQVKMRWVFAQKWGRPAVAHCSDCHGWLTPARALEFSSTVSQVLITSGANGLLHDTLQNFIFNIKEKPKKN